MQLNWRIVESTEKPLDVDAELTQSGIYLRKDIEKIEAIRNRYRHVWRDVWPPLPNKKVKTSGCVAVNRPYINPYGDVLPCSYLHMKLGNINEQPLKEILEYGFSFQCFSQNNTCCYTGEDKEFMERYCSREMSILKPVDIGEIM